MVLRPDMGEMTQLSLTEWAVLALLGEGPAHPFAIARQMRPDADLGRIFTVRRPLVYRAVDRLVAAGLAHRHRTEAGEAGPRRTVHRITPAGRRRLQRWLARPVAHVRDLRIELLLKLALMRRSGVSPRRLVESQMVAIGATLEGLIELPEDPDEADLWRHHAAAAAAAFLDDLRSRCKA
ncbi:MAG: PadR family transcriptional regulator [Acidimicrobiia bacterium]